MIFVDWLSSDDFRNIKPALIIKNFINVFLALNLFSSDFLSLFVLAFIARILLFLCY